MTTGISAKFYVHPLVIFQIIESYERRNLDTPHIIGALLGSNDKCGRIEVKNSYCVLHKELDDKVEADLDYAAEMYDLNLRICPNEKIIGWYTTSSEITAQTSLIHDYYKRLCEDPVLLTVDAALRGGRLNMRAYISVAIGVPGGTMGTMFTPITVAFAHKPIELTGFKMLSQTALKPMKQIYPKSEFMDVLATAKELESKLNLLLKYVNDVLERKRQPDNAVGRQLLDLMHSVPMMSTEQFTHMFNKSVRDLLMAMTMSSLANTQMLISEKLTLLCE